MKKAIIFAAIHGDETYGIDLYESFIEKYPDLEGQIKLVIGNKEANKKKVRFIDTDMNRAYGIDNAGHETIEISRVEDELNEFSPDYIFDIHTTRRSSGVFYISDSLKSPKDEICSMLDIDILVMQYGYVGNSFVGNHPNSVSLEYSLRSINKKTTIEFIDGLAKLLKEQKISGKHFKRKVYKFKSTITRHQLEKYPNLKSYDERPEGIALMVPKDESEMDAEYFGFWCRE